MGLAGRRRFATVVGLIGMVTAASVGTAIASGNSIHIRVPSGATAGVQYSVKLHGFAAHSERLYMFIDHHKCGANPAVEHARANGDYWTVNGSYHKVSSGWSSPVVGKQHVCGYLQSLSKPLNAAGGVLAHTSKSFMVS